jgi:glycosyltransferase involved in cell wall biosynthesis
MPILSRLKSLIRGKPFFEWHFRKKSHYRNYRIPFRIARRAGVILDSDVEDGDIVIATFWMTAHWAHNLCKSKGRPMYLVQGDEGNLLGKQAEKTYELPMKHIYVSHWLADKIRGRHPESSGVVIPNAIDEDFISRATRSCPNKFRLGTMWGGIGNKASNLAIAAVKQVRDSGLEVELVAFGSTRPDPEFKVQIDQFRFCPSQEEVRQLYSSCNAWLFTSISEGFGLPVLEAMGLGTPVIGTDTGAAAELIPRGGGWLVPIGDEEMIINAIVECYRLSSSAWELRSQKARETAMLWTWPDAASRLNEVFFSE